MNRRSSGRSFKLRRVTAAAMTAVVISAMVGCSVQPLTTREKGTLAGTAVGAGTGAIVGSAVGAPLAGAAIGGVVGGGTGMAIGNALQNNQDRRNR